MIDRVELKMTARETMSGKKPSVFFVAFIYVAIFTVLLSLVSALLGYDKVISTIDRILLVTAVPTYSELVQVIPALPPLAGILVCAIFIVKLIIDVGFMGYCLKISRNEEAESKVIFDSFALFLKILCLEILQLVFITFWSFLFIFPGIVAYYNYRLAFYIQLDNPDFGPLDCIRQSKRMMDGYKAELFFLDLSFLGWYVIDIVVRAIAVIRLFSIWLLPYIGVTRAGFYNLLRSEDAALKKPE